ncbi:MAG: glycosyltransferase family 2 protein [Acidobacteria bacterium]|nr:glycosyltransferase family 2 protein [Acidobacteriota bacterium]
MKVTVAMPAYNAAPYVCEAVESVLAQDYDQYELIVMDDASRDATWKYLKRYSKHPKVRLFRNRRNLGVGATRNRITCLSRGEYITPCDADDLLLPEALRRLSQYLDRHPRIGAVYGDILELVTDQDKTLIHPPMISGKDSSKTWDLIENAVNHAGSMVRKSLMIEVGGYDEAVYSVDDWSLWLKLAEISRFKYLQGEVYYVWRRHPASLTQTDRNWQGDVEKIQRETIERRYYRAQKPRA